MKTKKRAAKPKSRRSKTPKLFPIDDEMKEFAAMLEKEISDWPGVTKKPMFGFHGLYRNGVIFAALPRSRAMHSPRSLIFKFASMSSAKDAAKQDSRIDAISRMPGSGWHSFEVRSVSDLRDALEWLGRAYKAAKN
jgi:hypothetical protein